MSSFIQNLRFSDRETSDVSADLGQPPYENDTFVETFTETKSCAIGKDGIRINYDLNTIAPKYFEMTKDGVVFAETGQPTYTTGLGRLCAVQQAFQAVELPPNATTLKINDTILVDAGIATQTTTINDGTAIFSNAGVGGLTNPQITLNNTNTSATLNDGVVNIEMYKSGRNAQVGENLGSISVYGNDGGSQKTEFARIQVKTENVASGNEDGTLSIFTSVNGVNSEVFNFNGAQNENNTFRPLDLNGNNIRTTTGDLTITSVGSSGSGNVAISAKGFNNLGSSDSISLITSGSAGTGNINLQPRNLSNVRTDSSIQTLTGTGGSIIDFAGGTPDDRFDIDNDAIRLHWNNLTDQADITLENDMVSVNSVINMVYQSPAGNMQTILQNIPSIQRFQQLDNINARQSEIRPDKIQLTNSANGTTMTLDNNFAIYENKLTLSSADNTTPNYTLAEIVNRPTNQLLELRSNGGTSNSKTLTLMNETATSSSLTFNNQIDGNPFNITSNQDLNISSTKVSGTTQLTSAGGVQITGENTIALLTNTGSNTIGFTTGALTFTGAGLQSNTAGGNSGEHLVITLNGTQYKIKLENV